MSNEAPGTVVSVPGGQAPAPITPAAPAPEAQPQTTPPPAAPVDDKLAAKFAVLTRKEQTAVRAAAEAKAEKEAAAKLRAEAQAIQDKWGGYKGNKAKALEALKELGLTYDDITQLHLNGGAPTPEMTAQQLQQQIDDLRSQRVKDAEDARNAEVERAKSAEQQAVANFQTQIQEHVTAEKAAYPLLSGFGQVGQVWARIQDHYNQTRELDAEGNEVKAGRVLSIPEAAKLVEDDFRAQVKKAQEILNPPQATPAPTPEASKPAPSKLVSKPNTLTPSTAPVTSTKPKRYESDDERLARVVAKYSRKPA